MNLKLSVPKGVDIDSVSFSLPFDIDKKAKNANGAARFWAYCR